MTTTSPQPGVRGREAILDSAAVLMDLHGVDQVSLNEINRASGNRNRSAVTYHFGSRDAIVRELVSRSMHVVEAERNSLLDLAEAGGVPMGLRDGLEMVVGPMAGQLATIGGRRYLRLLGQLVNHPRFVFDAGETIFANESVMRCLPAIAPALGHLSDRVRAERVSSLTGFVIRCLSEQARLTDLPAPPRPTLPVEAFVANLVDVMAAMLQAPSSVDVDAVDAQQASDS